MAVPEYVNVTLTSPESIVWEGEALSVTSENSEGIFDLYPDHARFMTLLEHVDLVAHMPDGVDQTFAIEKAVLLFQDAVATIYLHTHINPEPQK